MKKLLFFYKELIATFWMVPVLIIGLSIVLSVGLVSLDNQLQISQDGWFRFFMVNSSDSARSILSTIAGAMIGVAGTVFSVTLVAITLASSQFGPRLIKNFMYVRLNQIVLGSYVATYLYCLLVLNAVKDVNDYTFIPSISILFAIVAAGANIILLIVFIHQIAVSIQADQIIANITDFIFKDIKTLFPENLGEGIATTTSIDSAAYKSRFKQSAAVLASKSGYLRYIDNEGLMELVVQSDAFFELYHRPGSYLVKGMEVGKWYSHTAISEQQRDEIQDVFVIGANKTSQQDLEFSIYQMVEIAARALSPGVNDPFTAVACIDNLTSILSYLVVIEFPSKYRLDDDGNLRIIADVLNFEGVLDAAFNQIRQFSVGSTAVIIRLMEGLIILDNFDKKDRHKKAILKHARMVLNIGKKTIDEKNDLQDLMERSRKILRDSPDY